MSAKEVDSSEHDHSDDFCGRCAMIDDLHIEAEKLQEEDADVLVITFRDGVPDYKAYGNLFHLLGVVEFVKAELIMDMSTAFCPIHGDAGSSDLN